MNGSSPNIQNISQPSVETPYYETSQIYNNSYTSPYFTSDGEWILLCTILTTALIIFILLWAFAANDLYNQTNSVCFGPFGVITGLDGNPINSCGTNGTDPCIFAKNTLSACEDECNNLKSICNAFTFNPSTSTMKIVNTSNVFASTSANLFSRQ